MFDGLKILIAAALLASSAGAQGLDFAEARLLLETHCQVCHSEQNSSGGFDLQSYPDLESIHADPQRWERLLARLRNGEMPPRGVPAPAPEERERLIEWIGSTLGEAACAEGPVPGPHPLRRLNRAEYSATVRDLLNVHFNAGAGLPDEGAGGEGFDNAAETLFLSPIHAEKYLDAARRALEYAITDPQARETFLIAKPDETTSAEAAARTILEGFLPRAFRRPVTESEIRTYLPLFGKARKRGEDFEPAVAYMLQGVLISPRFLFFVEEPNRRAEPVAVNDFELASRLSYFLWGSMPDEELFRLAAKGRLSDQTILEGKVECMLGDRRTRIFSERFIEQWLGTRELGRDIEPDAKIFPEYQDAALRAAIRYEPILFFDEVLSEDLSLLNLIDSDFSLLNKELVKHYGLEPMEGLRQQPVVRKWPYGARRGGLLPMAAVLAVSSYPNRTSPVLRGKWVLETLLGEPPPPPPPDVPELAENHGGEAPRSLRERLERHRADPACASCHSRIDPIGFGLENYDVLGRWRDEEDGHPIDAAGVLPDGTRFDGPAELKLILLDRKDQFLRVLTEKMLAYALGRGLTLTDRCTVGRIVERVRERGYRAHALVIEIVNSAPFRLKPAATESTE